MNRHPEHPRRLVRNAAYREVFQRLDAALVENNRWDNFEKIRLLRQTYFSDVDALQKSGRIKIPE